eukprot:747961-Hanusia_phi.AAC.2
MWRWKGSSSARRDGVDGFEWRGKLRDTAVHGPVEGDRYRGDKLGEARADAFGSRRCGYDPVLRGCLISTRKKGHSLRGVGTAGEGEQREVLGVLSPQEIARGNVPEGSHPSAQGGTPLPPPSPRLSRLPLSPPPSPQLSPSQLSPRFHASEEFADRRHDQGREQDPGERLEADQGQVG